MKVIRYLAVGLLAAGCSAEREAERRPEPERAPVAQPAPSTEGTAGVEPSPDARPPAKARPARSTGAAPAPPTSEERTDPAPGVNEAAVAIKDFRSRVDAYMSVRARAVKGAPKLKDSATPEEIQRTEQALATHIRDARADAKVGDIFTPQIRQTFRRLLAPEMKGEDGRDARAILKDDAPKPSEIPFTVNAEYPPGAPLPTVPASLLLNLPTLPEPLEYRIIGRHLVLLDTDADLIVDYMANAIR